MFSGFKYADICFIIDSSGSIKFDDPGNWARILGVVSSFVNNIDMAPGKNRIAVITYSDTAVVNINLDDHVDKVALQAQINGLPYVGRGTNTYDGLLKMNDEVFIGAGSADRKRLAILITDGKGTINSGNLTKQLADQVKARGIEVVAIGVTKKVNLEELQDVASEDKVVLVSGFKNFVSSVSQTLVDLIPRTPTTASTTTRASTTTTTTTPQTTTRTTSTATTQMTTTSQYCKHRSN